MSFSEYLSAKNALFKQLIIFLNLEKCFKDRVYPIFSIHWQLTYPIRYLCILVLVSLWYLICTIFLKWCKKMQHQHQSIKKAISEANLTLFWCMQIRYRFNAQLDSHVHFYTSVFNSVVFTRIKGWLFYICGAYPSLAYAG